MTYFFPLLRLKNFQKLLALFLFVVSFYSEAVSGTYTTRQTGNFNDPAPWSSGTVPKIRDMVVVKSGHILTINVNTPVLNQVDIEAGGEIRGDGTAKTLSVADGTSYGLKNAGTINFSGSHAATIKLA